MKLHKCIYWYDLFSKQLFWFFCSFALRSSVTQKCRLDCSVQNSHIVMQASVWKSVASTQWGARPAPLSESCLYVTILFWSTHASKASNGIKVLINLSTVRFVSRASYLHAYISDDPPNQIFNIFAKLLY